MIDWKWMSYGTCYWMNDGWVGWREWYIMMMMMAGNGRDIHGMCLRNVVNSGGAWSLIV